MQICILSVSGVTYDLISKSRIFKTIPTISEGLKTTTKANQIDFNGSLALIAKIIEFRNTLITPMVP